MRRFSCVQSVGSESCEEVGSGRHGKVVVVRDEVAEDWRL